MDSLCALALHYYITEFKEINLIGLYQLGGELAVSMLTNIKNTGDCEIMRFTVELVLSTQDDSFIAGFMSALSDLAVSALQD